MTLSSFAYKYHSVIVISLSLSQSDLIGQCLLFFSQIRRISISHPPGLLLSWFLPAAESGDRDCHLRAAWATGAARLLKDTKRRSETND